MLVVHSLQTHARDLWCLDFHIQTYLKFCDRIAVAVDSDPTLTARLNRMDSRIFAIDYAPEDDLPADRVDVNGMRYNESGTRNASLAAAMTFEPSLIVFGDTDEVPTPDVVEWVKTVKDRPQKGERWYVSWVNLFGDYSHAIGGESLWSFQCARGNKKCLAMQPGGDMRYTGSQHVGMEPGRPSGGPAPKGEGRYLVLTPLLLHLKYASEVYKTRPESKLKRHAPDEMLKGGRVVDIPSHWVWPGMPM